MFFVSDIYTNPPEKFSTSLQKKVYHALSDLQIAFKRVETDQAITMEDCVQINATLNMKMVKTLFLCNRQQTAFYLFITTGGKPFKSKVFSTMLKIPRVSFAPSDLMKEMLGTEVGAATVFSALFDTENKVQIVFDKDVLSQEWYGCSDGTTTSYIKVKTEQIVRQFLPYSKHIPVIIEV